MQCSGFLHSNCLAMPLPCLQACALLAALAYQPSLLSTARGVAAAFLAGWRLLATSAHAQQGRVATLAIQTGMTQLTSVGWTVRNIPLKLYWKQPSAFARCVVGLQCLQDIPHMQPRPAMPAANAPDLLLDVPCCAASTPGLLSWIQR